MEALYSPPSAASKSLASSWLRRVLEIEVSKGRGSGIDCHGGGFGG